MALWAGRLAWLGHWLYDVDSIDVNCGNRSGIDWKGFESYLERNYSKTTIPIVRSYAHKYDENIQDVHGLNLLPQGIRNNVLKSLVILPKFSNQYESFRYSLKSNGIKMINHDNGLKSQ